MTPQRMQHFVPTDTGIAIGAAVTIGSVLLELVSSANVILVFCFVIAVMINFLSGTLRSYAEHRRAGRCGKWFSTQKAAYGIVKKFALMLFVPLAGIVDSMMMVAEATRPIAEMTPTIKGVLVALCGVQVVGAARSLHAVVGDEAIPALAVLLRSIDREHVGGGELPRRRVTDPVIDALADDTDGHG